MSHSLQNYSENVDFEGFMEREQKQDDFSAEFAQGFQPEIWNDSLNLLLEIDNVDSELFSQTMDEDDLKYKWSNKQQHSLGEPCAELDTSSYEPPATPIIKVETMLSQSPQDNQTIASVSSEHGTESKKRGRKPNNNSIPKQKKVKKWEMDNDDPKVLNAKAAKRNREKKRQEFENAKTENIGLKREVETLKNEKQKVEIELSDEKAKSKILENELKKVRLVLCSAGDGINAALLESATNSQ